MSIKLELPKVMDLRPRLTVIGVGGAGCNAINNMIAAGLTGVEFVAANTDAQALDASSAERRVQLGVTLTEGLGAGSKPEIGEAAAEEAIDEIRAQISGSHMVFVAAGMGGGTGTGAAAVIARTAKELGILTVGVVTKPFQFEGGRRMRIADAGIAELKRYVDTLIVIPNQNLFRIANDKTTFAEAFVMADQVLYSGVACIVDLIIKEGLINLDFADVRTVMSGMGTAMMGTGEASGERRAAAAAEEAISNPLLDDVSLKGAKGLLLSITGGRDLTLYEVDEAASRVRQEVDPEANIIVGATFDDSLGERVRVSIVASGMSISGEAQRAAPGASSESWPRSQHGGRVRNSQGAPEAALGLSGSVPGEADLQRRLSAAIQYGPSADYGAAPSGRAGPDNAARPPREAWRAPGNVVIEEGLPQLTTGGRGSQPTTETRNGDFSQAEQFTPAAPAEIRRNGRRMPDVDDFPAVGQREYRAKAPAKPVSQQAKQPDDLQPAEERRRPGLLGRLTGLSRRLSDSAGGRATVNAAPHPDRVGGGHPNTPGGGQNNPHDRTGNVSVSDYEVVDNDEFLWRERH